MKRILITVILLIILLISMAITCEDKESENCHITIRFVNNTPKSLYVDYDFDSSDKEISNTKKFYFYKDRKRINCCKENKSALHHGWCYEDALNGSADYFSDLVCVYILDAAVVEKENTSKVIDGYYSALKRYDLTLEDLQRLDWKITYPPTEAMKDVKQWPPYGYGEE